MKFNSIIFVILLLFLNQANGASFFESLWPKKAGSVSTEIKSLPRVIYEVPEFDEKFLQEAEKLLRPNSDSEIDRCHQRVIMKLNRHCNELSSEQLGKLSVMILNCQANAEGRKVFPCTTDMTLKQCTVEMDPNTWNVYHQITNRAKAICVSTRQDQFRGLTELTVNKLMQAAQSQLNMMKDLLDNQNRLNQINKENIDEINENDAKTKAKMEEYQIKSIELAEKHKAHLVENALEFQKEKSLKEFAFVDTARRLQYLQTKMATVSSSLKFHEDDIHLRHSEIVEDVEQISSLMKDIVDVVNLQGQEALKLYNQTKEYMEELNENLAYLTHKVSAIRQYSDGFVTSFQEIGIDVKDDKFASLAQHVGNLVVGMLILVFLRIKFAFRFIFVTLILLNGASTYYRNKGVDLAGLNSFFVAGYCAYAFTSWFMIFLNSIHDGFMKLREIAKMSVEKPTSFISHSKSPNKVTISSPLKQVPKPTIVSTAVKRILLPSKPQPLPISPLTKNSSNDDNESADQEITKIFVNQSLARDPALNVTVTLNDSSRESSVTPYLDRPNTPYEGRPLTPAMKRVMGESFDAGRSGTPFAFGMPGNRVQCQGLTKKGEQCKNAAVSGHIACRLHK